MVKSRNMKLSNIRLEVMETIEQSMDELLCKYLRPIEENWQPSDLLPDSREPGFLEEIEEIQALAKEMSYDLFAVLIGDTVTEEALPTYEAWLVDLELPDLWSVPVSCPSYPFRATSSHEPKSQR